MNAYRIFCKTGSEKTVAENINRYDGESAAIAPTRTIQQKHRGVWKRKDQILLPGYVFIFSDKELTTALRENITKIYKILEYQTGLRALSGADYDYSMWIFGNKGNMKPSRVLTEGDTVKVIDGPLSDGFGKIVKMDRHRRKAWIEFEFDGQKRIVSLSAEYISAED